MLEGVYDFLFQKDKLIPPRWRALFSFLSGILVGIAALTAGFSWTEIPIFVIVGFCFLYGLLSFYELL